VKTTRSTLSRALPRAEAYVKGHWRSGAERAEFAGGAKTHRELRHLAYSGHRHGGFDGRLGRRPDEESDYRKFIIRGDEGNGAAGGALPVLGQNDDFASMREAVTRRYRRVLEEKRPMPSLILIDGGIGQLHAAAQALESLQIINQPMASIAKREEILYILGQEDEPCILDRHSPVLHLIQQIRDETHRFARKLSSPAPRQAADEDRAQRHSRRWAEDHSEAAARIRQHRKLAAGGQRKAESRGFT